MNRHTYQKLRRNARRAQRAWWTAIKDPYASNYERGRLNDQMHDAQAKVPGGMSRASTEVMLEGWFWRRSAVTRRITDRKAKARIAEAVELMSMHSYSQSDWRWAA